jgi:hypothetical protein
MDGSTPEHVTGLCGSVTSGRYARGTKSERDTVFLIVGTTRYVLRRKGGPAFGDDALTKYTGHTVRCDGFIVGTTFLAEQIAVVE